MLKTWNLVRKYTHICSFRKYTISYQESINFADYNIFLQKLYLYSKQQYKSYVRDFSVMFSVFVKCKVTFNESASFTNHVSGIQLPDCSKLAINWKNDNDLIIFWHRQFVLRCRVSLLKFNYWSKFQVNIITGSGVTAIFVYKRSTRNPEIRILQFEFCPISGDWGELGIHYLALMSLMKLY